MAVLVGHLRARVATGLECSHKWVQVTVSARCAHMWQLLGSVGAAGLKSKRAEKKGGVQWLLMKWKSSMFVELKV